MPGVRLVVWRVPPGSQCAEQRLDLAHVAAFVEEMAGTGVQADAPVLRVGEIGQHDERDGRGLDMYFAQHVKTAAGREADIEHYRVRAGTQDAIDRFGRACGAADDFDAIDLADQSDKALANQAGVFHHEDAGGVCTSLLCGGGMQCG